MEIDSKELEEFVRSACQSIEKGIIQGYKLTAPIKFEVAVVNEKKAEGGIKLFVVGASGEYKTEQISKITFEIGQIPYNAPPIIRTFKSL